MARSACILWRTRCAEGRQDRVWVTVSTSSRKLFRTQNLEPKTQNLNPHSTTAQEESLNDTCSKVVRRGSTALICTFGYTHFGVLGGLLRPPRRTTTLIK